MKRTQYKNGWCLIGLFCMAALLLFGCGQQQDAAAQQEEALLQVTQQWAQTFADRDGAGRYALMTTDLQQQIDGVTMEDGFAYWMPVWVTGEDGQQGMFLRGSSPWPEDWQVELHRPDGSEPGVYGQQPSARITYKMTDSGPDDRYVYQEAVTFVQDGDTWKISGCEETVALMDQTQYDELATLSQAAQTGEERWRFEPEAVAQAFVQTQLQLSGGTWDPWEEETNSIVYHAADGVAYTLRLERPIHNPYGAEEDVWMVAAYTYPDAEGFPHTEILL